MSHWLQEHLVQIQSVCKRFGGDFQVETGLDTKKIIKSWKGTIIHLSMYGMDLEKAVADIDADRDLLIIVGAEKVPPYYYQIADMNVSVGNQPHSEVAALALFLDRLTKGAWQRKDFHGNIQIIPSNKVKKVFSKEIP
jgi:tRNA (cytidine56-2'-O)-methyltransferase